MVVGSGSRASWVCGPWVRGEFPKMKGPIADPKEATERPPNSWKRPDAAGEAD